MMLDNLLELWDPINDLHRALAHAAKSEQGLQVQLRQNVCHQLVGQFLDSAKIEDGLQPMVPNIEWAFPAKFLLVKSVIFNIGRRIGEFGE